MLIEWDSEAESLIRDNSCDTGSGEAAMRLRALVSGPVSGGELKDGYGKAHQAGRTAASSQSLERLLLDCVFVCE